MGACVVKAVGYKTQGAIDRPDALLDVEIEKPAPSGRDLLVEIKAVSVNPVDSKLRTNAPPDKSGLALRPLCSSRAMKCFMLAR
jgi:NADPH:quinone reductase-like Zn-dependent oxidoreductase